MNEYPPSRYTVSLRVLLNQMGLLFDDDHSLDTHLGENDRLTLALLGGNGSYELENEKGGRMSAYYVYHPNGNCEGKGLCQWCGTTLFDAWIPAASLMQPPVDQPSHGDEHK